MNSSLKLTLRLPLENTFVLNFNGAQRSWEEFHVRNHWGASAQKLIRFPVINPHFVAPPTPWQGTDAIWARTRGLLSLLEMCLNQRIPSAMVIDDDMSLVPDAPAIYKDFVNELPFDWQLFALAGQHVDLPLGVPTRVNHHVFRPFAVDGVKAFAWRSYPMLRELYDFYLQSSTAPIMPRDFFAVHRHQSRCIYTPDRWVFRCKDSNNQLPDLGAAAIHSRLIPQTVIAVLGAYRGGSSCMAGVLHHLGVAMGEDLASPDSINPNGYFECKQLLKLCKQIFDHPSLARRIPEDQISGLLRQWAFQRSAGLGATSMLGAKHPSLCCLGKEMKAAWGKVKFVVVDRPVDQIVDSIVRTPWGWSREEASINVATVLGQREQFLESCSEDEYLRVDYSELCEDTVNQVLRLREWLALDADNRRIQAAIDHVRRPTRI